MDFEFELRGIRFVADADKARRNVTNHGVTFEEAAQAFFDPFALVIDASRNDEARDALIGADFSTRLLYVVHIAFEADTERIRLISARLPTREERNRYENY